MKLRILLLTISIIHCNNYKESFLSYSKFDKNPSCFLQNIIPVSNFKLECADGFLKPSISFIFPASSYTKTLPNQISIFSNHINSKQYFIFNTNETIEYTQPFLIPTDGTIQYYSIYNNQMEVRKNERYSTNINLPNLFLTNITNTFINKDGSSTITFTTDTSNTYKLYQKNTTILEKEDTPLLQDTVVANTSLSIKIYGKDLIPGTNLFTLKVGEAYTSFYLYRDDQFAYPIVSINEGSYNHDLNIKITATDYARIFYSVVDTDTSNLVFKEYIDTEGITISTNNNTTQNKILKVKTIDIANNESPVIPFKYTIDKEPPIITVQPFSYNTPYAYIKGSSPNRMYYISQNPQAERNTMQITWKTNEISEYSIEYDSSSLRTGNIIQIGRASNTMNVVSEIQASQFHFRNNESNPTTITLYVKDSANNIASTNFNMVIDNSVNIAYIITPLFEDYIDSMEVRFNISNLSTQDLSGIDYYELELANNKNFINSTIISNLYNPNEDYTFSNKGIYYAHSRAKDNVGNVSPWSPSRKIFVNMANNDINNQGKSDFIVGAAYESFGGRLEAGKAYIYLGEQFPTTTQDPIPNPPTTLPANITIEGENNYDHFGYSIAFIKDINLLGKDDILISAPYADPNNLPNAGKVYLFLGESIQSHCSNINTCTLQASQADSIFTGERANDLFGYTVSYASDYNEDNYSDFMIGAIHANTEILTRSGSVYLYKGGSVLTPPTVFHGRISGEIFSSCLTYAGDTNADGYGDILIGAASGNFSETYKNTGTAYLYFGGKNAFTTHIKLLGSEYNGGRFGDSCTRAYDLNQDGFEDILVGAPLHSTIGDQYGTVYLYNGQSTIPGTPDLIYANGAATGQFGQIMLVAKSETAYNVLLQAPGINTLYYYNSLGNKCISNCQQPSATPLPNMPIHSLSSWGKLHNNYETIIAIGNTTNSEVLLYDNTNLKKAIYKLKVGSNSSFGFSLSK